MLPYQRRRAAGARPGLGRQPRRRPVPAGLRRCAGPAAVHRAHRRPRLSAARGTRGSQGHRVTGSAWHRHRSTGVPCRTQGPCRGRC
ncbi:hypothetical protein SA15R_00950 [Rothia kristinae]|nr:hypothetical protein SA15R_00950 [Rothia kristinae]